MVISSLPHLEIVDWLQRLDLETYEENFKKFNGVEELIELTERDIKSLGVKNSSHRARMISSLVAMKGKLSFEFPIFQKLTGKLEKRNSNSAETFGIEYQSQLKILWCYNTMPEQA